MRTFYRVLIAFVLGIVFGYFAVTFLDEPMPYECKECPLPLPSEEVQ